MSLPAGLSAHMSLPPNSDALELFDHKYYSSRYGLDPNGTMDEATLFDHWKNSGRFHGMDPHPLFSIEHYTTGVDPAEFENVDHITHFLTHPRFNSVSPHPAFDSKWYSSTYSDVRSAGVNPLLHYLKFGHKEGRRPSPTFDGDWYLRQYGDVREAGMNPLIHYVLFGKDERRFQCQTDFEALTSSKRGGTLPRRSGDVYRLPGTEFQVMDPVVCAHPGPSLRFICPRVTGAQLLSLDIWDTLLYRRCHPDEVKIASARFLFVNYHLRLRVAYRDVMSLYKARRVGEDASSLTSDFEYRFEDAALRWVEMVFEAGTPRETLQSVVKELERYELAMEVRTSYVNTAMTDFLNHEDHPPVTLVSDFYMSGKFMLQLLQAKGLEHSFVRLYCSSDYVENKRSGTLFQRVVRDFALAPGDILHIGDNKKSDVESAHAEGLNAVHYRSSKHEMERGRADRMLSARLAADLGPLNHALVEQLNHISDNLYGQTAAGALQRLGFRCAPLAIGFVLHIIERARLFGVDKLFFFTREGVFFKKLYEAVVAHDPYGCRYPEAILLDVSRIATFAPSIQTWTDSELMRLWSLYSTQSPAGFTRSLNLDHLLSERLFQQGGVDFNQPIEFPWLDSDFMKIVMGQAFTQFAQESISRQRGLLRAYLAQSGFDVTQKVNVVVDIGWRGSIQDNISKLCAGHVHGCYLALFGFLNPQPLNSSKSAWLFDQNVAKPQLQEIEVAPIEMLFNSLGGSVSGYQKSSDGVVRAERNSNEAEDKTFTSSTFLIQEGIIAAVSDCIDFVSVRGLTSGDMLHAGWNAFENLLKTPPPEFAAAFFGLCHNEVFGTGEYYNNDSIAAICASIATLKGPMLHSTVSEYLAKTRWNRGLSALPEISQAIASIDEESRNLPSSLITLSTLGERSRTAPARIGFLVPAPLIGSGGHRTIFKIARQFALRGCEVFCYLESEGDGATVAQEMLGNVDAYIFLGWDKVANLDVAFATIAHSAAFVAEMPNVKVKCYLVQDYEAFFNPIGDFYTIAENSYSFGLEHFTIGNWLTHVLTEQHNAIAIPSGMGIDLATYFVRPEVPREFAICYLYQPEKPRRNGLLGIEAMRLVKEKLPKVKIYVYGSNRPLDLDFETEQLGLIRDLSHLNALYNRCAVGLCISMSNPSRIPFEMMACGTVPVDVYRYNNLFDYKPRTGLLAHQSAKSVAHAIVQLLEDEKLLGEHRRNCVEFTTGRSAEWEADVVVNSALQTLAGRVTKGARVNLSYTADAVIAPSEPSSSVAAFCSWQRRLATM